MNLKNEPKALQEDWYSAYYPDIVPSPVWAVDDGLDAFGEWVDPELVLPISGDVTEFPIDKLMTKKVEAIMDVPDMVSIDTPDGMIEVPMFNIPPRTEPFPVFQGEMYYDPWQMKEIDTNPKPKAQQKPKKAAKKTQTAQAKKAADKVGNALQKKYAMLKKHTESDKVKQQIQKLDQALENKKTELASLIQTEAASAHVVPKIKLQEEDLVIVEPSTFACVRSLNHNVLCLPRATVDIVKMAEKPAAPKAEALELYQDLEFLLDDESFVDALAELDALIQ